MCTLVTDAHGRKSVQRKRTKLEQIGKNVGLTGQLTEVGGCENVFMHQLTPPEGLSQGNEQK